MKTNTTLTFIISHIDTPGGTERALVNWANTLMANGYSIRVISIYTKSGESYYPFNKEVSIIHLGLKMYKSTLLRFTYGLIATFIKLYKQLRKREIVIGLQHNNNVVLAILKKLGSKAIMVGCEQIAINEAPKYSIKFKKFFYKYLNALIVLTEYDKKIVAQEYNVKKCVVIPNQISFLPDECCDYSSKNLLAIGRFEPQKGFDILIEIVDKLLKKNKDWHLTIIGDGYLKQSVETRIAELQLEKNITILPSTKNILPYFLNSSIYLLSSRFEGMPLVLLEAKACGLPIVAFDCPTGPAELVETDDGILVPFLDKIKFEEAVELFMNDESLRKRFGQNAKKNAKKYDSESIYKKWENLFSVIGE